LARIEGLEEFVYVWTLGVPGVGNGADKLVTIQRVGRMRPDCTEANGVVNTID